MLRARKNCKTWAATYNNRSFFLSTAPVRIGRESLQKSDTTDTEISWYACGPTVYDDAHLGHARTYVTTDIIRRLLQDYFHIPVRFAMGMTDIDDKIITKGSTIGLKTIDEYKQFTRRMEREFVADMDALNVQRPDATLRVTEHIPEIIEFVTTLIKAGHAYVATDGVYFAYNNLPVDHQYDRFGNLGLLNSHDNIIESIRSHSATSQHDKRDSRDFALWKLCTAGDTIGWDSPWGKGRPGWHIECSTMTYQYFGTRLDIHSGGIDLQFPHHTNEIAQSECHHRAIMKMSDKDDASCCFNPTSPWVTHWLHTGHIHIAGRKMSKSLKNFISIRDYLQQQLTSFPDDDFRIFCLQNKYDSLITYSEDRIRDAAVVREKITSFLCLVATVHKKQNKLLSSDSSSINSQKLATEGKRLAKKLTESQISISKSLSNDFHTPAAIQVLLELISHGNVYGNYLLQQLSSTNAAYNMEPCEPLLSTGRYVSKILGTLGLRFVQNTDSTDKDVCNTSDNDKLLHLLVELRSSVRSAAVQELKASKLRKKMQATENKVTAGNSSENEHALVKLCQDILETTDKTRKEIESKVGIILDDSHGSETVVRKK